jgi:hypothetical protein
VITGSYSGDDNYNAVAASNSIPLQIPVGVNVFQFTAPDGQSQTIAAGQTATYNLVVIANGFAGSVTFACTGAPAGMACTVAPSPAVFNGGNSLPLVVKVAPSATSELLPSRLHRFLFASAAFIALMLVGLSNRHRRTVLVLIGLCLCIACGGGPTTVPPAAATIVVSGKSGSISNSISLTLTVNH